MTADHRIPAAAPAWVRATVRGADRPARVVHRGSDAVYLDADGSCLGVLSAAAIAVPCGARTSLPRLPQDVTTADHARLGEGRIRLGRSDVVIARTVDAAVPRLPARRLLAAAQLLNAAALDRVGHVRAELPAEDLDALATGHPRAVSALLGRGSGLTPVGDDVLAGWLATMHAGNEPADAPVARENAVAAAVAREAHATTTLLSATLLDCARRGDVIPQFRTMLLSLADDRAGNVDESVEALLRVGHTSGAGMALGTLLALRHLASRSPA